MVLSSLGSWSCLVLVLGLDLGFCPLGCPGCNHFGVSKGARCGVEDLPVTVPLAAAARAELVRLTAKQAAELGSGAATAPPNPQATPAASPITGGAFYGLVPRNKFF